MSADYDPNGPHWFIMTKARNGTVSVIRGLTLEEARRTYERLDPFYGMHSEQFSVHRDFLPEGTLMMLSGGAARWSQDSDIEIREVFGPPGWEGFDELDHWPKITTIYTDDKGNILPDGYQESGGSRIERVAIK